MAFLSALQWAACALTVPCPTAPCCVYLEVGVVQLCWHQGLCAHVLRPMACNTQHSHHTGMEHTQLLQLFQYCPCQITRSPSVHTTPAWCIPTTFWDLN